MKKLLKLLLLSLTTATLLQANTVLFNKSVDDDFAKMQSLFNSMLAQSMPNDGLANFGVFTYPKVDIKELKDKYLFKFNLAGVNKKDIKLSLKDNALILEGEKKIETNDKKNDDSQRYIKQEMFYGKFKRIIVLPDDVVIDKLNNKFKNGILEVSVPKSKKSKSNYKVLKIN
jgi:HSP20 family protein